METVLFGAGQTIFYSLASQEAVALLGLMDRLFGAA